LKIKKLKKFITFFTTSFFAFVLRARRATKRNIRRLLSNEKPHQKPLPWQPKHNLRRVARRTPAPEWRRRVCAAIVCIRRVYGPRIDTVSISIVYIGERWN